MNRIYLDIAGGGWITVSGAGQINEGDEFSMPEGQLAPLRRELCSSDPDPRWGRLDRYSKAGLIAASLAIKDAGLDNNAESAETAIIVSTFNGSLEVDHKYYKTVLPQAGLLASPNLFAYTLPNCMLGEIAIRYGFTGPAMVVSQPVADMLNGVLFGAQCLYSGLSKQVVAGYCDVECDLDPTGNGFRPGAVFLVMRKAAEPSPLAFDGENLLYEDTAVTTLVECIEIITHNQIARSSE
ncbi:MAG: beta-ketoacyl synthase N-terminal-like domain-containing protein [Planctomycetota bacterium]